MARITICKDCRRVVVHGPITIDVGCRYAEWQGRRVSVSYYEARFLRAIALSPHALGTVQLADLLYEDCEDGGPLDAYGNVAIFALGARRKLESIGCRALQPRRMFSGYALEDSTLRGRAAAGEHPVDATREHNSNDSSNPMHVKQMEEA